MRVLSLLLAIFGCELSAAAELPRIRVSDDRRGFVTAEGQPFVPWGFNYDRDHTGKLLEDFWIDEWPRVAEDFAEMKTLGANVVRVHLQLAKFMQTADEPNAAALAQLKRLARFAESTQLYLDVTGLGCYHKADVPAWYDELDEAARWQVQARFWKAVAATLADSPAVFCYDLMNEPVSPAGKSTKADWLGPAFGGKHYVQRISLDHAGRTRPAIAKAWIHELVTAIRSVDRQHLITVGLVDWSLDRPGLTSGFVPAEVCMELDFVAVHLYPKSKQLDKDLETLRGFQIGKPVIIEETFPLGCTLEEMADFLTRARPISCGCISFYWGQTPEELTAAGTLPTAVQRAWLEKFQTLQPSAAPQ